MKPEIKKLLILNLPYLLFVWLFDKVGAAVRLSPGADASAKLLHLGDGFTTAFSSIAPSFHPADLLIGIAGAVIVRLIIYTKGKNAKKYRRGTEYGSARWGGADDIKPYTDPVFENNIPLTQTERLTMNSRPKQPKYARNKNILVIGGSGSGKTRFFVKPSLMQCTSKDFPTSYIVTDPKGTLILETGKMLQRYKYRIKVLNTINFKKSMKYNPFAYLRSEKDILKLVNTIIANTKGDGEKSGEDFWVKAEKLYYTALIGYIWYEAPEDEKNFTTLLEMINASEAREDDEDFQNPVDLMFERLEEKDPEHFAVKQYKKYKLAAGKTAKSILISCGARLAPFDIKELRELISLIWCRSLMSPIYSLSATFISNFLTVRSACNAIISPMSFTLSAEIGSANKSPSLRYFPFENFVTNISILTPLNLYLPFSGKRRRCIGRLVSVLYISSLRKSTGQRQNRCVQVRKCLVDGKRAEQGNNPYSALNSFI